MRCIAAGKGEIDSMYKIRNALARFMYGRNGVDQLNVALLWGYLLLWIPQMILAMTVGSVILDLLLDLVRLAMVIALFFRIFSRNLDRRRAENQWFVNGWWRMRSRFHGARERHADKAHKYFTCKNCKTICRVPVGKGKIIITCPKCGAQIQAKT